jgi:hypothetical protein
MMTLLVNRTLALLLATAALAANAAEVGGVKLDDRVRVQTADLQLNGAGVRTRYLFDVYAIGLYLAEKKADPAAVVALPGNKRVAIHMLRDVGAETFIAALTDGVRANHSQAEVQRLEPRLKELAATMAQMKEARKGSVIALDFAGSQTQLVVDGKPVGRPIDGEDFYRALLRIWLGDKPVQEDLKKALLGQGR